MSVRGEGHFSAPSGTPKCFMEVVELRELDKLADIPNNFPHSQTINGMVKYMVQAVQICTIRSDVHSIDAQLRSFGKFRVCKSELFDVSVRKRLAYDGYHLGWQIEYCFHAFAAAPIAVGKSIGEIIAKYSFKVTQRWRIESRGDTASTFGNPSASCKAWSSSRRWQRRLKSSGSLRAVQRSGTFLGL